MTGIHKEERTGNNIESMMVVYSNPEDASTCAKK
jgi:hypothetical protein